MLLRHENLVSYVLGSVEFASADEAEAALVSVPPYHIAAVANVITNLYAGRRTLVLEAFTPGRVAPHGAGGRGHQRDGGADDAGADHGLRGRQVVPSLRSLSYGGAPMPAALIERALREWPRVDFVNAYGLTETSSTVALARTGGSPRRAGVAGPGGAGAAGIDRQAAARDRARDPRSRGRSPRRRPGGPDLRARRAGVR